MAARELAALTWEEARAALPGAIAVLPAGALEAHGPHLPLNTDVIIAQAMARAGAELLSRSGHDVVLLPPLAYSAAPFAIGFAGTVSVSPAAVTALVVDTARGLAGHGAAVLAIANAHFDPAHVAALRQAEQTIEAAGLIPVAYPDLTRRHLAERLTEEFRSGACHAGQYETSIVLAERPDLVRDDIRAALPAVPRSLTAAIREGRHTFEEAGGPRAYFGDPAAATAEEGARTVRTLGEILAEAVEARLAAAGTRNLESP